MYMSNFPRNYISKKACTWNCLNCCTKFLNPETLHYINIKIFQKGTRHIHHRLNYILPIQIRWEKELQGSMSVFVDETIKSGNAEFEKTYGKYLRHSNKKWRNTRHLCLWVPIYTKHRVPISWKYKICKRYSTLGKSLKHWCISHNKTQTSRDSKY